MQNNKKAIWYEKAASRWFEALPVGNGRLGGMVYGGIAQERIDLTESTCYSGKVEEGNKDTASTFVPKVREALCKRDFHKAEELSNKVTGIRDNYGTHLPMGSLNIAFDVSEKDASNYKRSLDLDKSITQVTFNMGDVHYKREIFASNPDQVITIKLSSSKEKKLGFVISYDGEQRPHQVISDGIDIMLTGRAIEERHTKENCGVSYSVCTRVLIQDGSMTNSDGVLIVTNATQAILYIAMHTTFNHNDANKLCMDQITAAQKKGYSKILDEHIRDYSKLFSRVDFDLACENQLNIPTDKRLEKVKKGVEDHGLTALMFHYARYLLISSSRENSPLPAHLQGVWNDNVACNIGWTCDMHLDINTQMNYWPAQTTNLSECTKPLFDWIENTLVPSGRQTAKKSYACKGWVAHTVSNPWGYTAPGAATYWGFHPTGGAWIATHMWEHYLYSKDMNFLRDHAYPVLKAAAEFFMDYMFVDPMTGYLVTGPSHSPENQFIIDDGKFTIGLMPTCDIAILIALFDACIEGAKILGMDQTFASTLEEAKSKFPPYQVGKYGQLQEWLEDYEEALPHHRHTSHLLGVYPFGQITPEKTPDLIQAVRTSIQRRTTPEENWEDTGWARSMLIAYYTRLWDGDMAYHHILAMQRLITETNLFVIDPPSAGAEVDVYELDGNTGLCACIAEMFLQSYDGEIHLLPAIPKVWEEGYITGLCAVGGYEVDIYFKHNQLNRAIIRGEVQGMVTVKYKGHKKEVQLNHKGVGEVSFAT